LTGRSRSAAQARSSPLTIPEETMAVMFNADEIFEIALELERNGAKFYRKAADGIGEEKAQQLLYELAAWEDEHFKTFSAMRESLSGAESGATAYDPDQQAQLYLQAFADGHVFDLKADPAEQLQGTEGLPAILKEAIGLEKDSVIFYLGIREMVPAELGRERVEKIISEEMSHITKLSRELASVGG
jgi:rubrerythrin